MSRPTGHLAQTFFTCTECPALPRFTRTTSHACCCIPIPHVTRVLAASPLAGSAWEARGPRRSSLAPRPPRPHPTLRPLKGTRRSRDPIASRAACSALTQRPGKAREASRRRLKCAGWFPRDGAAGGEGRLAEEAHGGKAPGSSRAAGALRSRSARRRAGGRERKSPKAPLPSPSRY